MKDKLFIIGNGFDMAHDLKTNYLYFKRFVYQQAYGKNELLESLQSENAIKLYLKRLDEEILEYIEDLQIPEIQMGPDGEDWYPNDEVLFQLLYQLISQITKPEDFWSDFEEKLAKFDKVFIENMDLTDKDGDTDYTLMAHIANELGETLETPLGFLRKEKTTEAKNDYILGIDKSNKIVYIETRTTTFKVGNYSFNTKLYDFKNYTYTRFFDGWGYYLRLNDSWCAYFGKSKPNKDSKPVFFFNYNFGKTEGKPIFDSNYEEVLAAQQKAEKEKQEEAKND